MILTVTLNLALDVTYEVPALTPHSTHRVRTVRHRAGGKGVNVARVLGTLGQEAVATGLCGGPTGALVVQELQSSSVPHDFTRISGDTRRVVTITDSDATVFAEPGPAVLAEEWEHFQEHFSALAVHAEVVVLSGSLPQGFPATPTPSSPDWPIGRARRCCWTAAARLSAPARPPTPT